MRMDAHSTHMGLARVGPSEKNVPSLRDFPVAENHVTYSQLWARGALTLIYILMNLIYKLALRAGWYNYSCKLYLFQCT